MSGLSGLGGAPRCPRCRKAVYFAEEVVAKGKKWHKTCLSCANCKKTLDSFTMNEHEDDLYCKTCYKNFAPTPAQQPRGSISSAVVINAEGSPNSCARCHKQVYFAEEAIAIGKKWHKTCLKCSNCSKRLDSGSVQEHDSSPFCKSCYSKLYGPQGSSAAAPSRSSYTEAQAAPIVGRQSSVSSSGPRCPRCQNTVYFAEEVIAVGKKWHKSCLKCNTCRKTLDSGSLQEHDGMPYCRSCYGKDFGPSGYGFGGGAAGAMAGNYGDKPGSRVSGGYGAAQAAQILGTESSASVGPKCSRCQKTVYFAEEVIACKRKWHKYCLKCEACNKLLEIGSLQEHDAMLYCRSCYGKNFGPKGYGFGGGGAGLSLNRDDERDQTRRSSQVQEYLESATAPSQTEYTEEPRHSYGEGQVPARSSNFSGAPQCPRCDQPVYFAEEVFCIGVKWHKACLKCNECGKKLDTSSVSEHSGEIYCKTCYGKSYGPKGYGFAGGAAGGMAGSYPVAQGCEDYEPYDGSGEVFTPSQPATRKTADQPYADEQRYVVEERYAEDEHYAEEDERCAEEDERYDGEKKYSEEQYRQYRDQTATYDEDGYEYRNGDQPVYTEY